MLVGGPPDPPCVALAACPNEDWRPGAIVGHGGGGVKGRGRFALRPGHAAAVFWLHHAGDRVALPVAAVRNQRFGDGRRS